MRNAECGTKAANSAIPFDWAQGRLRSPLERSFDREDTAATAVSSAVPHLTTRKGAARLTFDVAQCRRRDAATATNSAVGHRRYSKESKDLYFNCHRHQHAAMATSPAPRTWTELSRYREDDGHRWYWKLADGCDHWLGPGLGRVRCCCLS